MKRKILLIVVTILISICALFCMKTETFAALTCQHDGKVALAFTAKDSSSHYTKLCGECGEGFGTTESHYGGTATCTSKGKCTACGYEYKAALGHSYSSKVTKSATCTATGVKTYTCTRCSNSYTEEISALGHNYVQKYNDTQHYMECSRCGDTKNFVNHEWSGVSDSQHRCACGKMTSHTFTAATCTKDKQCSECDWIISNSKLGHAPGTTIVGYKNIAENLHVPEYECKNGCGTIITRWYY